LSIISFVTVVVDAVADFAAVSSTATTTNHLLLPNFVLKSAYLTSVAADSDAFLAPITRPDGSNASPALYELLILLFVDVESVIKS